MSAAVHDLRIEFGSAARNDVVRVSKDDDEAHRWIAFLYGWTADVKWLIDDQVAFKMQDTCFVELAMALVSAIRNKSDFSWDPADWGSPVLFFWYRDGQGPRLVTTEADGNLPRTVSLAQELFFAGARDYVRNVR